jgi:hypothetical protein
MNLEKLKPGRPRAAYAGLTPAQWLKSYLSGGSRSANEIFAVGEQRGFGRTTLKKAKLELGTIGSKKTAAGWMWMDSTVPDIKPESENKLDVLLHKMDEVQRKVEVPRIITEDGPTSSAPPDLSEVDAEGYLLHCPVHMLSASISPIQVIKEINRVAKENHPHAEIVKHILQWAYPNAGMPESMLVKMLRANHVQVLPKVKRTEDIEF